MTGASPFWDAGQILLAETGCRVRKYRTNLSGMAYWSTPEWFIDVPRPTTARRFGVFAHEVGHHVLHRKDRGRRKLARWQQEAEADAYALACFARFGLPDVEKARADMITILAYKAYKIARRGNPDCAPYTRPPQPCYVEQAERWLAIAIVAIKGNGDEWSSASSLTSCAIL